MSLLVRYTLTIGYKGADVEAEFEIEEQELKGLNAEQRKQRIQELAYNDAQQYVEVVVEEVSPA